MRNKKISPAAAGMASSHLPSMSNDEWLTPPKIISSLGEFDLDPCASVCRPWDTAKEHFSIIDNGLLQPWDGRVWLNPPYGKYTNEWMNKMSVHNNGIALIFARTETGVWQDIIFKHADSILFIRGRLIFFTAEGKKAAHNAGAPSALVAFGSNNGKVLQNCTIKGKYVPL